MKKRMTAFRVAAVVLGMLAVLMFGAVTAQASVTMKTTKAAYLRTGPSSKTTKIVKIPKGKTVTAGVSDGKYTKVKYFLSPERAKDLPPFEGSKPEKLEVSNEFTDINEDDLPF